MKSLFTRSQNRHLYRDREGKGVDGILYKSAARDQGVNCVLSITNKDCLNYVESMKSEKTKSNPKVLLETVERIPEVKARLILPIPKPDAQFFILVGRIAKV